ncbi:hypothetical protein HD554DRAFT_2290294 [Boletus coccyginus]|nr:hypothetical protein HD554DRAFT_2290294 [Boletus coccyginus]
MSVPSEVKLVLCFNGSSKVALSIPLAESKTFAVKPLKWLRYLGFIIYGRQGYISKFMNGSELDYTEEIEARSYYFVSDGELDFYTLRSFLTLLTFSGEPRFVDVDAMDNRTSSASDISTGTTGFRAALVERDGTCVLSGFPPSFCHACHLIPHSKGDSYMSSVFNHRREMYGLVDPLDGINDSRNGILLNAILHTALDAGDIAFLMTPNFALTVDDIPYHQPLDAGNPTNRLTLQHIRPSLFGPSQSHFSPHNSDARQPQDLSQWPPAIIADLSYASAVLRAWGTRDFNDYLREISMDSYYGGDDDGEDVSRGPTTPHQPTTRAERYERWSAGKERAVNPADRSAVGDVDVFDALLILPWARARERQRRLPDSETVVVPDNGNKIQAWLQSIEE